MWDCDSSCIQTCSNCFFQFEKKCFNESIALIFLLTFPPKHFIREEQTWNTIHELLLPSWWRKKPLEQHRSHLLIFFFLFDSTAFEGWQSCLSSKVSFSLCKIIFPAMENITNVSSASALFDSEVCLRESLSTESLLCSSSVCGSLFSSTPSLSNKSS